MNAQLKPVKQRVKTEAATFVPASREEVDVAIAKIGELQRERESIRTAMNTELARVKGDYEAKAAFSSDALKMLSAGVQMWCETNRAYLTRDGKSKTAKFGAGEVRWRTRPPSVLARGLAAVIESLKRLGMQRFVRVKEELDKEAILREPEAVQDVKGLSITQGEDFVIVPFATELEEVA